APIGRNIPYATDELNGFIYSVEDATSTAYKYDPALDTWSEMSSAGLGLEQGLGSLIDGVLHVVARVLPGDEYSFLSLTFDPSTNTWGSYPEPDADAGKHHNFALCGDGDSLYLFGGSELLGAATSAS